MVFSIQSRLLSTIPSTSIVIHVLVIIQSGECFLTEKPKDAVRAVGESATFTCNSSWTVPIRWWFLREGGTDETSEELGTNAVVRLTLSDVKILGELGGGSPDGYRSVLTIDAVTKWHAGTFRCQDGTGSRGFAHLTVTSTPETVCLTVSPRDQVVVTGDSVVLTASSPSTRLRYYYESLNAQPQQRVGLYNGEELNDSAVTERYSVVGVGDQGHADLVIRSVQPQDAGRYVVKDVTKKAYEVAANVVVLDRYPECTLIRDTCKDDEIQIQCHAKYTGLLTPRVSFLRQDVTEQSLQKTMNGGIISFRRSVKFNDLTSSDIAESHHFEMGFELSQCGEPTSSWTWRHIMPDSIELPTGSKPHNSWRHWRLWRSTAIAQISIVSVIFNVVLIAIVIVLCGRIRRGSCADSCGEKAIGLEYGRLHSKSSSESVCCEEAKA